MPVDYNLVIVGSGAIARYAAQYARSLNARVALVTRFPLDGANSPGIYAKDPYSSLHTDVLALQFLHHLSQSLSSHRQGPHHAGPLLFSASTEYHSAQVTHQFLPSEAHPPQSPLAKGRSSGPPPMPFEQASQIQGGVRGGESTAGTFPKGCAEATFNWSNTLAFSQTLIQSQMEGRSLSALEQLGIDVVYAGANPDEEPIQFCQGPELKTPERTLRSHAYLIAEDGQAIVPPIPGIESGPHTTLDRCFSAHHQDHQDPASSLPTLPQTLLVISDNHQGIETASCLAALGVSVTLVMAHPQLADDPEADQWLHASLLAVGVTIYCQAMVTQVEYQGEQWSATLELGGKTVAPGASNQENTTQQITADSLLFAMGRQVDFAALRLKSIGVHYDRYGITVDRHYRSNHPPIFACGDAIGSSPNLNQRYAEAAIAVHHALFQGPFFSNAMLSRALLWGLRHWLNPPLPPLPSSLPTLINIGPPLAQVGFTELQARQRYGDRLTILRQSYQSLDQAQLLTAQVLNATTGYCKLLVLDNGQIVGAQIWGLQAEEIIGAIALAMQQSIPLRELAHICPPMPSIFAEVMQSLGMQWERDRLRRRPLLFDWLELVFNWQRDWTR